MPKGIEAKRQSSERKFVFGDSVSYVSHPSDGGSNSNRTGSRFSFNFKSSYSIPVPKSGHETSMGEGSVSFLKQQHLLSEGLHAKSKQPDNYYSYFGWYPATTVKEDDGNVCEEKPPLSGMLDVESHLKLLHEAFYACNQNLLSLLLGRRACLSGYLPTILYPLIYYPQKCRNQS
jgi:hypothetical protein